DYEDAALRGGVFVCGCSWRPDARDSHWPIGHGILDLRPGNVLKTKGAGRQLAAVRGGHLSPAPAGRPHGPRRCGGPEHHGVFAGRKRTALCPSALPKVTLAQQAKESNSFLTIAAGCY